MGKIVATIEARMNSTRLPKKVLKDIGAGLSLQVQLSRLAKSKLIDEVVIATTINDVDLPIVDFAKSQGVKCFRGSEEDILGRILGAAQSVQATIIVQTTGDCPMIAPEIVDQVISTYLENKGKIDFVSNEIERSFPIGLDCRVFSEQLLSEVDKVCKDPTHRVHGSTYIYLGEGKNKYKSLNILAPKELHHPDWRWTLDTAQDLLFFQTVFKELGPKAINLSAIELASWLEKHPEIVAINNTVRQKTFQEG